MKYKQKILYLYVFIFKNRPASSPHQPLAPMWTVDHVGLPSIGLVLHPSPLVRFPPPLLLFKVGWPFRFTFPVPLLFYLGLQLFLPLLSPFHWRSPLAIFAHPTPPHSLLLPYQLVLQFVVSSLSFLVWRMGWPFRPTFPCSFIPSVVRYSADAVVLFSTLLGASSLPARDPNVKPEQPGCIFPAFSALYL